VLTLDAALQHTCASFHEHAARGEITAAECDLLIDGAILLAVNLDALIQDAHAHWPEFSQHPAVGVMAGTTAT
jgi:hypothetical protein